jgi:putative glutamine amidotransferase
VTDDPAFRQAGPDAPDATTARGGRLTPVSTRTSPPVIGISAYADQARWGVWDMRAVLVPERYVTSVEAAGGLALVIPPRSATDPRVLDRLDGLVLSGGPDVDPARFGQDPHPETLVKPERDAAEFALLAAALDRDVPVLGVCRGMQVMAVQGGGTLEQHLPDRHGEDRHRAGPGQLSEHAVTTQAGSRIRDLLGPTSVVNSYHHQGVADPGRYTVTGHADDGTIEVLELPDRRFVLGVQWHPEMSDDPTLFRALVAACGGS